mmetsp:Transcript_5815/g.18344  ORF Transcript_5815/g.18344 Transcript_5815/m.18344 type:complete len:327 (-) Transcript_5815:55-1035(-)
MLHRSNCPALHHVGISKSIASCGICSKSWCCAKYETKLFLSPFFKMSGAKCSSMNTSKGTISSFQFSTSSYFPTSNGISRFPNLSLKYAKSRHFSTHGMLLSDGNCTGISLLKYITLNSSHVALSFILSNGWRIFGTSDEEEGRTLSTTKAFSRAATFCFFTKLLLLALFPPPADRRSNFSNNLTNGLAISPGQPNINAVSKHSIASCKFPSSSVHSESRNELRTKHSRYVGLSHPQLSSLKTRHSVVKHSSQAFFISSFFDDESGVKINLKCALNRFVSKFSSTANSSQHAKPNAFARDVSMSAESLFSSSSITNSSSSSSSSEQ